MKNRALQVSLVRKDAQGTTIDGPPAEPMVDPEVINRIAKEQIENIAKTIGAILLTKKAADTVSELILIAGRKYL